MADDILDASLARNRRDSPAVARLASDEAQRLLPTLRQLSPAAAALLRLTSYLAPEPIPVEMFEAGASIVEEAVLALGEEHGAPPDDWLGDSLLRDALAELAALSLVTREGASFTVPRMVQEVLRSSLAEERRPGWIERSLRLVSQFSPLPPDDPKTWPVWDRLRPHAAAVSRHADAAFLAAPAARLMLLLSILLQAKSLPAEAEPWIRRALQIHEESLGPEHPDVAVCLNHLAQLLEATDRRDEAEPLLRRALEIDEEAYGPRHPRVATDLSHLAQWLHDTHRLVEAEPLLRRALDIDEEAFGPRHPEVATDLANLAQLLQDTLRLDEAEPLMRRALEIDEEALGPHHPEVATDLTNLARLLRATPHRRDEAEPLLRQALEILEQSVGPEHPKTRVTRRILRALFGEQ